MKIIQILPELDIGGVERHVIDLSNELAERGHDILVISNGGQMQVQLSSKVQHRKLPVHKKNPITAYFCSRKITTWIKKEGWELIHAHSRVPAWIAWFSSCSARVPWMYTAHACYSLNFGLTPLKHANLVICVSETVQKHIKDFLPTSSAIILVAQADPEVKWDHNVKEKNKFIFVGRLTKIKGLDTVIEAFGKMRDGNWTLDVLGDGPESKILEERVAVLGLHDRITFHGYIEETDTFMSKSSCLLFPSHSEGYGLVLARAIQIGLPVIASNIPAVLEMAGSKKGLVAPGDVQGWCSAIFDFISTGRAAAQIPVSSIPTLKRMVDSNELIYLDLVRK